MIKRLVTLLKHWREAKSAFSTLGFLYSGKSDALDALGGLTDEEMQGLIRWLPDTGTFVEVGTLFGITAKAVKRAKPNLRVIAVDNFSWNPFGLPGKIHEQFTRRILDGSGVEIINCSSADWRTQFSTPNPQPPTHNPQPATHNSQPTTITAIFFDASHAYADVKEECEWARAQNIPLIAGHDYNNANPRFGVTRAVDEVFGKANVETAGMCWKAKR